MEKVLLTVALLRGTALRAKRGGADVSQPWESSERGPGTGAICLQLCHLDDQSVGQFAGAEPARQRGIGIWEEEGCLAVLSRLDLHSLAVICSCC